MATWPAHKSPLITPDRHGVAPRPTKKPSVQLRTLLKHADAQAAIVRTRVTAGERGIALHTRRIAALEGALKDPMPSTEAVRLNGKLTDHRHCLARTEESLAEDLNLYNQWRAMATDIRSNTDVAATSFPLFD